MPMRPEAMSMSLQFTTVLDILEDWLDHRGWGFQRIDGDVSKAQTHTRPLPLTSLVLFCGSTHASRPQGHDFKGIPRLGKKTCESRMHVL